jgi:hypothetical protein
MFQKEFLYSVVHSDDMYVFKQCVLFMYVCVKISHPYGSYYFCRQKKQDSININ